MATKSSNEPKPKSSTYCLFENISEAATPPFSTPARRLLPEDILSSKSKLQNLVNLQLDRDNFPLNETIHNESEPSETSDASSKLGIVESQKIFNGVEAIKFRQLLAKRLQERAIERLKADGVLVYCANVGESESKSLHLRTACESESEVTQPSDKKKSKKSNEGKYFPSDLQKEKKLSPSDFEKLDAALPNHTNPFRRRPKNKPSNTIFNGRVPSLGNIFIPGRRNGTEIEQYGFKHTPSKNMESLVESPASSLYSPSATSAGEIRRNSNNPIHRDSRQCSGFSEAMQCVTDANCKGALVHKNLERLSTRFVQESTPENTAMTERNLKFSFAHENAPAPIRKKSLTPPILFNVPPVPESHYKSETLTPRESRYINDPVLSDANFGEKIEAGVRNADQTIYEEDKYNQQLFAHAPAPQVLTDLNWRKFPFQPQIQPPCFQPWCYFTPTAPNSFKLGPNFTKSKFSGRHEEARTAATAAPPYQQFPIQYFSPEYGVNTGYGTGPMYPPPAGYGLPGAVPYGYQPNSGMGGIPYPRGGPGAPMIPGCMPMQCCRCPCPAKVPKKKNKNKNDVRVVVKYTTHGPPPCCCKCSCCDSGCC